MVCVPPFPSGFALTSESAGGELVVLRVPLSLDPKDPNAKGNKVRSEKVATICWIRVGVGSW